MNVLAFERKIRTCGPKRVRRACFHARSQIARSSICFVANAVRETLASLIGPLTVRTIEPRIPSAETWNVLLDDARVHRVRGSVTSAAFVLRRSDALALALCAFGEAPARDDRALSAVEEHVLQRVLAALTATLAPLCGQDVAPDRSAGGLKFVSYFELTIAAAERRLRIGVALAAEPALPPKAGGLTLEHLAAAAVEVTAELACGILPAQAFIDLRPGTVVPMTTKIGEPGTLKLDGAVLARGTCGTSGSRYALVLE